MAISIRIIHTLKSKLISFMLVSILRIVTPADANILFDARGLIDSRSAISAIGSFFDEIAKNVKYKCWYFGSVHFDRRISGRNYAVFTEILPIHMKAKRRRLFM